MANMRILGIDPGSETTGWAVLETEGRRHVLVEYGTLKASTRERFSARLLKISNGIEQLITKFHPDVMSIEETFFAVNVKSALKLGQARGVALVAAERAGLEIHEYSARLVKQTVVGYGNAEKHQVQEMVRILLSLPSTPQPHDAADAIAIALCHFHHAGTAQRLLAAEAKINLALAARPNSRRRATK